MSNQDFNYDPTEGDSEGGEFAPLPAGWYTAEVVDSEVNPTAAGGKGINLQLEILGPTHAGRKVFWWINTAHPSSEQAVEIGRQELYRLCAALRIQRIQHSTTELHGKAIEVKLTVRRSEEYGDSNNVKACRPLGDVQARSGGGASAPAAPPASAGHFDDDDIPF